MSEKWLSCKVEQGMFSDENVVVVTNVNGESVSFFVPKSTIENGRVRVMVFEKDQKLWAVLPTEDRAIVPVSTEVVGAA